MTDANTTLWQLTLLDPDQVSTAGSAVQAGAAGLGLDQSAAVRLQCITEDLCRVVAARSFDTSDAATLGITLERRAGGVAVVVTDAGMPSELSEHPDDAPAALAELVHQGFANSLSFSYSAKGGNRAEIFKQLDYHVALDELESDAAVLDDTAPDGPLEFTIRSMEPEDVWAVARLFFRCYRDTYQHPIVYEPDRFAEHVAAGLHRGTIAVLPDGTVGAHVALTADVPRATVGLGGMLVVDPRFRGERLATKVGQGMSQRLISEGVVGLYGAAVTKHKASQKMASRSGNHEVAVLLAKLPGGVTFEGFAASDADHRESVVWTYSVLGPSESVPLYPPARWRAIIEETYAKVSLEREIVATTPRITTELPDRSEISLAVNHLVNDAVMTVSVFGKDFRDVVRRNLLQLCLNRIDVIYIDLPLIDPLTAQLGSGLNELGFFLGGVLPNYGDGDVLRLQYLNNYEVSADSLQIATEWGQELADAVLASRDEASRKDDVRTRSRAYLAPLLDALDDD